MLFVFHHEDYWSFWMADMKFPLDIVDSNLSVIVMNQVGLSRV